MYFISSLLRNNSNSPVKLWFWNKFIQFSCEVLLKVKMMVIILIPGSIEVFTRLVIVLQKFFLQGRFIFGPDVRSLGLTIFLIVAPVTIFCIFVAGKLMDDFGHHWGISIMVVAVVFTLYVSSFLCSLTKFYPFMYV